MSDKKPLLEVILDEIDRHFCNLEDVWKRENVNTGELIGIQNNIVTLFHVLHNADLGERSEDTQKHLNNLHRPGTDWSAVSIQALRLANELKKGSEEKKV